MKTTSRRPGPKERPEDRWQSLLRSEQDLLRQRLSMQRLGEKLLDAGTAEDDEAVILHEGYISEATKRREVERLREVDEALTRIERGEYGHCEECGDDIPAKRLQAIPWARFCVPCQERLSNHSMAGVGAGDDENGVPW